MVSQAGFCSRVQFLVLLLLEINEIKGGINEATTYRNTMKLQKTIFIVPMGNIKTDHDSTSQKILNQADLNE